MRVFKKLSPTLDPSEQRRLKIAILSTTQSLQWCDSRKGFVAWITKHESHACSIMSSVNINNFANQPRTVDATPNYWRYNDTGVSQSAVAWVSLCFIDQTMWNWTILFAIEQHCLQLNNIVGGNLAELSKTMRNWCGLLRAWLITLTLPW